jgi:hypothetical protein
LLQAPGMVTTAAALPQRSFNVAPAISLIRISRAFGSVSKPPSWDFSVRAYAVFHARGRQSRVHHPGCV